MEVQDHARHGASMPSRGSSPSPAGEAAASPPTLRVLPWLAVSSFVREDSGPVTLLTLRGEQRMSPRPPKRLQLIVDRGGQVVRYEPASVEISRGAVVGPGRRHLSVCVTFELPPALAEDPTAVFQLLARRRGPMELPAPSHATDHARVGHRIGRGAVAAALSVTTLMAAPAGALAAGGSGLSTHTAAVCRTGGGATAGRTTSSSCTATGTSTMKHTSSGGGGAGGGGGGGAVAGGNGGGGTPRPTVSSTGTKSAGSSAGTVTHTSDSSTGTTRKSNGGGTAGTTVKVDGSRNRGQLLGNSGGSARHRVPAPPTTPPLPPITIAGGGGIYSATDLWGGGSLFPNPYTQLRLEHFAAQAKHATRPPKFLVRRYEQAARRYHLPWQVLAAINYIETGYGRDLGVSSAGAVGWMQFMPTTWAEYGEAVSRQGHVVNSRAADPWLPRDAIFSAAHLLVADGGHRSLARAVFRYNHAGWYVQEVLTLAERIVSRNHIRHQKPKRRLAAMETMAHLLNGIAYTWGGGHTADRWVVQVGYDCSGFVSAVLHAGGYLQFPQTTQTLPGQRSLAKGPGRWVTIFDRTDAGISGDHVIIDLNGRFWEEGGGGPAGGSMVHRMHHVTTSYLRTFNVILHPKGL